MSTYPNFNSDPEIIRKKTKDDGIKDSKYRTEKNDHENIVESLGIDKNFHKKRFKVLKKRNVSLDFTESFVGSGSVVTTSKFSKFNPSIGIVLTSSTALLISIAVLITNEYISKLKKGKLS